jgi:uncharacterized membrane protein
VRGATNKNIKERGIEMARNKKSDKAVATDLITAIINLIAVLINLIYWLLDRGR